MSRMIEMVKVGYKAGSRPYPRPSCLSKGRFPRWNLVARIAIRL